MIELSEIIFPALVFLLPITLFIAIFGENEKYKISTKKISVFLYLAVAAIAIFGVSHFKNESRLDLTWGVAPGSSTEFEFSLHLSWVRFVWILCVNLLLAGFEFFRDHNSAKHSKVATLLPMAASLFASLAFLSENYVLSIMFIEVMLFLLYAQAETENPKSEEFSAYFKRGTFVLISLLLLFSASYFGALELPGVVLLASITYILSMIFSRSRLYKWQELPLFLVQMAASLFLLNRLMHINLATELWFALSIVFGIISIVFSSLSFFSPASVGSMFWQASSMISFLLFMRFGSNMPHLSFWGSSEALGLLGIYAICMLLQSGAAEIWKKVISSLLMLFTILVLSGCVPGLDLLNPGYEYFENPLHLVMLGAQIFLIASSAGLSVMRAGQTNKDASSHSIFYCWLPSITVIFTSLAIFVNFIFLDTNPVSPEIFLADKARLFFLTIWPSVILGFGMGSIISTNKRFLSWAEMKNAKIEKFNFEIAELFSGWNSSLNSKMDVLISSLSESFLQKSLQFSELAHSLDAKVFGEKIPHGGSKYTFSLSALIHRVHSGNYRWYSFFGTAILFIVGVYYLVGWK